MNLARSLAAGLVGDMEILRKYGEATTILFSLIDAGAQDFENTPVTFASGDTQISKDEGAFANASNDPAHEGNGIYSLALTATEMQAARVVVTVIDSATKEWEDRALVIATYGDASAQNAFDLDTATVNLSSATEAQIDTIETGVTDIEALLFTYTGTCDTGATATVFDAAVSSGYPSLGTDAFNNAVILWTSGALAGTTARVVDSAYSAPTDVTFTVEEMATSPGSGDTFTILSIRDSGDSAAPTAAVIADAVWDEATADHTASGSFGEAIQDAGIVAGAVEVSDIVIDDGSSPLEGAEVWLSTDAGGSNIIWYGTSDASGNPKDSADRNPFLDTGTYYVWVQLSGYSFSNPTSEVVV